MLNRLYITEIGDLSVSQKAVLWSLKNDMQTKAKKIGTFNYTALFEPHIRAELIELASSNVDTKEIFQRIDFFYFSNLKECFYIFFQRKKSNLDGKSFLDFELNLFNEKNVKENSYNIFKYISNKDDTNAYNNVRQLILYANESFVNSKNAIRVRNKIEEYYSKIENSICNIVCLRITHFIERSIEDLTNTFEKSTNDIHNNPHSLNIDVQKFCKLTQLDHHQAESFIGLINGKIPKSTIIWKKSLTCLFELIAILKEKKIIDTGNLSISEYIITYFSPLDKTSKKKSRKYISNNFRGLKKSRLSNEFAISILNILTKEKI